MSRPAASVLAASDSPYLTGWQHGPIQPFPVTVDAGFAAGIGEKAYMRYVLFAARSRDNGSCRTSQRGNRWEVGGGQHATRAATGREREPLAARPAGSADQVRGPRTRTGGGRAAGDSQPAGYLDRGGRGRQDPAGDRGRGPRGARLRRRGRLR